MPYRLYTGTSDCTNCWYRDISTYPSFSSALGLSYTKRMGKYFYLNGGLQFQQISFRERYDIHYTYTGTFNNGGVIYYQKMTSKQNSGERVIEMFYLAFPIEVGAQVGPVGISVGTRINELLGSVESNDYGSTDNAGKFDIGLYSSLNFKFEKRFVLDMQYYKGLEKIYFDSRVTQITLGLTVFFVK